jgi:hypothetical protein
VLLVIVFGLRVVAHIEAGEAPHALLVRLGFRCGESVVVERRQALARVLPVKGGDELAVEHPVFGLLGGGRPRLGELPEVSLPDLFVEFEHAVRAAQGVQQRSSR